MEGSRVQGQGARSGFQEGATINLGEVLHRFRGVTCTGLVLGLGVQGLGFRVQGFGVTAGKHCNTSRHEQDRRPTNTDQLEKNT